MSKSPRIYKALALQTECKAVNRCASREESRLIMMGSIARIRGQVFSAKAFHGQDLKLICLPEYFLTSFPAGESASEWRAKAAIDIDGPEYKALGKIASDADIYLAGNAYENDPHFPELYFQSSFIIAPSGEVVLRYRRLISMYAPSPYDVWDKYMEHYSVADLFPVIDTPLGRLAALASEEIRYPEISRILAARGAEIILHPTSEAASTQMTYKNVAKLARAQENQCYVISANSAGITGTGLAAYSTDARSQIVDDRGIILCETPSGETITACADIDISALRYRRERNGMDNMLARQPMALYAKAYAGFDMHPSGSLGDGATPPAKEFYKKRQDQVIEKLGKAGII
ncbi:putative amidohydrolase [Litorimonas taeanensis]|uniref:Putative amidohydrolase n=1 Tax=Litorimonas taeanensis TaxID=568099 RepID=A0A420WLN6_9PROT|nr:nitrilase-related carbon-nitrogen hydrolase [Litorimonas taeanensis]RKQ71934.1 putative amidohydrolase [Litorimonas taeanensis]